MNKLIIITILCCLGNLVQAQVKVGANPTTLDATKHFEVEADDGNSVAVAKSNGIFSIDNTPAAASTDSILMKNSSNEVNEISIARLSGLMGGSCDVDTDGDGLTDDVDTDDDGDGVADGSDNCPLVYGDATADGCPPFTADTATTGIGLYSLYTLSSADYDVATSTYSLENMQIGECVDVWPLGVYAIKLALDANYMQVLLSNSSNSGSEVTAFGTSANSTSWLNNTGAGAHTSRRVSVGSPRGTSAWAKTATLCRYDPSTL